MPIEKDTNVCQQGLYMDTAGGACIVLYIFSIVKTIAFKQ